MSNADDVGRSDSGVWRGRAVSRVQALGAARYRIDLQGPLRPGWLASLGMELSARHLSVDRVSARRGPKAVWTAEIDVVRVAPDVDPMNLPYVALAESGALADTTQPLQLDRFSVVESTAHGGCIELTFEAPDALGLLGRVLADLALLVLFPVELRIETHAGRVHDQLWLTGITGAPPAEARWRLEQRFGRHLRG